MVSSPYISFRVIIYFCLRTTLINPIRNVLFGSTTTRIVNILTTAANSIWGFASLFFVTPSHRRSCVCVSDTFENQRRLETPVGNDSVSSLDGVRRPDGRFNDVHRPLRLDIIPPPPPVNHRRSSPIVCIARYIYELFTKYYIYICYSLYYHVNNCRRIDGIACRALLSMLYTFPDKRGEQTCSST